MSLEKDEAKTEMQKIIRGQDSQALQDCVLCYACEEYCEWGNHPMFLISEKLEEKNMMPVPGEFKEALLGSYDPTKGDLEIRTVGEKVLSMCWDPQLVDLLVQGKLF
jgi:Fe-S oxidoreductase